TCAIKVVMATESVEITGKGEVELKGKVQLTASALPADALQEFMWSTSNYKVATVSQTGVVTGVKLGTVTITATSNHDKTKYKRFTVAVITGLSSMSLSAKSASLAPGQALTLKPVFSPSSPTHKEVAWVSSDPTVATVENGVVVANKPGEATITATAAYNGKTATCVVSVSNPNTKASG
ncbi:MAG: Ig domain-containing protein, partial [Clostridiales bacterium]|nr:Ig domain-containing protein [Clostridiales bacterium]